MTETTFTPLQCGECGGGYVSGGSFDPFAVCGVCGHEMGRTDFVLDPGETLTVRGGVVGYTTDEGPTAGSRVQIPTVSGPRNVATLGTVVGPDPDNAGHYLIRTDSPVMGETVHSIPAEDITATCDTCGAEIVSEAGRWHHARIEDGSHDPRPAGAFAAESEHRANLGHLLGQVADKIAEAVAYWQTHDLPGDFLWDAETGRTFYPFDRSLDEVLAEVRTASDRLQGRDR